MSKTDRLSAGASGCIAASIILIAFGVFSFISFKQRPKASISTDQKSDNSVKTCTTVPSTKTLKSYHSGASTRQVHQGQNPVSCIEVCSTASSIKSFRSPHGVSSGTLYLSQVQEPAACAKDCTNGKTSKIPKGSSKGTSTHPSRHTPSLKSIPEIRFSPASVVALNAKMVSDRPKY